MKIGIVSAFEAEVDPFINSMCERTVEKHSMLSFHIGKYKDIQVVALYSGVCKVNASIATQVLINKFEVTHVIVMGVAGAIAKELSIYDTVISSEVAYHDVNEGILTQYHPWMKSIYFKADPKMLAKMKEVNVHDQTVVIGRIVTGESFIEQEGREYIVEKYNPLCVDMETASMAHVCYVNSIPFVAVRSISDTPEESGDEAFSNYYKLAAQKSVEVVQRYLSAL